MDFVTQPLHKDRAVKFISEILHQKEIDSCLCSWIDARMRWQDVKEIISTPYKRAKIYSCLFYLYDYFMFRNVNRSRNWLYH